MIYSIFPRWPTNVDIVDWPDELSPANKMLIGRVYPPIMSTESKVEITDPLKKDLELAIGITHFDLKAKTNMQLAAYPDSWNPSTKSTFNLHLSSKKGTTMFSAGFQACIKSEKPSKDEKPFKNVPRVVVWLQAFDFEFQKGNSYAVNAYAEDEDCDGFTIHVDALHGARLNSAMVSWVVYEQDPPGIMSGRLNFETFKKRQGDNSKWPEKHCVKLKKLGEWQLTRLYAGVSKFNFDPRWNLRMAVNVNCQDSSFEIDACTWADSVCNSVEVSYIAVCI
ncbi:hypothetical protein H0G86_005059 [Trichoderma simmonsii]|uniref:H-type lectin domain-containing protein n=1 Tax=Trichoderma simmonsii TaxID=1491479 RepID=A0A8G0PIJ3_9HYPO|nr:hypothetical protein H0G86_005059 [Trichoderma simmonsii]